ncbi:hypothetical protein Tdes44962_MAKER08315 [Teratosphaeria destructans]|uniref:Uncharacterized protein n=1 Tax=Teratosphaeria destructans TaxID=418781 RepID=A0A9W7W4T5_9PEZI|nr:hypothetical protein Tdes44962_MAKER08315 [Teratosphaeria destructans]
MALHGVDAFDETLTDLKNIDSNMIVWGSVERNLAVGIYAEVKGAVLNALPDFHYCFGRGSNVHVLSLLGRGVGNARCATDEDDLVTQFRTD